MSTWRKQASKEFARPEAHLSSGDRVLYRVRRLALQPMLRRSRMHEYVLFGVGTLRAEKNGIYQVERPNGTLAKFDGVGLYPHELRPAGG